MPIRKSRLTRTEQIEYRSAAQQLQAQGLIAKPPEWLEGSPPLEILTSSATSNVSELPTGTVYFTIWVQLVARQSALILEDCRIMTSWDDQIILGSDEVNSYCSPGGPVYVSGEVLNGRIENALRFRRCGDLVRGSVFFWGLRPIPDAVRTDAIVPFQLAFVDSLGNWLATDGTLHVNRRRKSTREVQSPERGLFSGVYVESFEERRRREYRLSLTKKPTPPSEFQGWKRELESYKRDLRTSRTASSPTVRSKE
jgi:hypothetical protein